MFPEAVGRLSVVNVADQFCDDLCVSVGLKDKALAGEECLDVLVVGDDPIMDN